MSNWMSYIIEEVSKENKLTKKQQSILIAAVQLISEKGYEGVSTAEIAKKAEVAEGTIFRLYKTKKDLLNAIVMPSLMNVIAPRVLKEFVNNVIDKEYLCIEDFVRFLVEERYIFIQDNLPLVKIVIQEMIVREDLREDIKEIFMENIYEPFNRVIDSIKKNDEIVDLPNLSIFRIMITNAMGYFIPRFILFPNLNWDDEKEKEITIESIIKILKKHN